MNRPHPVRAHCPAATLPLTALWLAGALISAPLLAQMTAPPSAAPSPSTTVPAPAEANAPATSATAPDNTVVTLSPFEVAASAQKGYLTTNTLAGTRLNTNIGDLAGSITVVTKQQLEDTNSLDINDVFRFEANTEGALTYTPIVLTRGQVTDSLAGSGSTGGSFTSATASGNRVRGLAAVDNEQDNFLALSRIPFNSYNTQSVEIDRGPNSIIYGSGSPAGIINQSTAEAVLDKFSGSASVAVSSWDGFRQTVGLNFPIIPEHLALYVAQMYNSQGFKQKPSSDLTRRQYAAITYEPFKSHRTRIEASFENFNEYANDPNFITPIDQVTPWLAAGRPVWNTVTDQVTYLSTGQTSVPYAIGTTFPNYVPGGPTQASLTTTTSPYFVPGMTLFSSGHNIEFINQGQLLAAYRGSQTGLSITGWVPATLTSSQALVNEERLAESTYLPLQFLPNGSAKYGVWAYPSITSKSIYDWSTININQIDNTQTLGKTYHVDLQQELLPQGSKWGSLNFDLGWFRQELKQTIDSPLSQSSATTMTVDENTLLPNGQPNSHEGSPFLDVYQADVYSTPEINNNWRGMLEYEVALQDKVPGWLQWMGHHRFLVSYSQHDDIATNLRYRPGISGGDPNYLPTPAAFNAVSGYGYSDNNAAVEQLFYLNGGNNLSGHATNAPGVFNRPSFGGPTSVPISTYNYTTGQWQQSTINVTSDLFPTGGLTENLQDAKTYFWQSFFWNDRIVGTLGIDDDQVKNRNTIFPSVNPETIEYTNGFSNRSVWFNEGPWSYIGGNTSTEGFVLHPFKNWSGIDASANAGNLLPAFLRTLSVSFNKSNNFNPPAAYYTDFFGQPLGKPSGSEKDYGAEIATPDNKFFLRATWFTTNDLNQTVSTTSGGRALYIDATLLHNWATTVVELRNGQSITDPNFGNTNVYPITAAEQTQIAALTGLPYNFGGNVGANGEYINPNETENGVAKGVDLELEYNPLPNWTMKLTWGRQQTVVSDEASEAAAWLGYRMPFWLKYSASDFPNVMKNSAGNPVYVGSFWQGYGYDSNTASSSATGNNTTQAYYNNVVGSALAVDTANNGTLAPNQREYSWSYLTNYNFTQGALKGVGLGTAVQFDGRAVVGYYGSTTLLNSSLQIAAPDITRPIYTPAKTHVNVWVSYQFRVPFARLRAKVQLNVADLTSNGYLLPITYNFDGSPAAERIIPPRQYTLTTSVNF